MALDIRPGDEVVTTPFTFAATAEMIVLLGARAVFAPPFPFAATAEMFVLWGARGVLVEGEEDTANIAARRIEAAITPKTKAIMPVSLYGQAADMDEINAIAARRGIAVIEDAAQ